MQVVINKCFLLNPEKKSAQIRLVVFKKNAKTHTLIPKNDVTEPKAIGYSNNQKPLIIYFQKPWFPEA